ncbi:MAG: RsiV family protein [candidate division Zixibacteria bacterium]|nr:RsiV family protein [candidate division Zixibacteria bacterium]
MIGLACVCIGSVALIGGSAVSDSLAVDGALEYQVVNLAKHYVMRGDSVPCCASVTFVYPEFLCGTDSSAVRKINEYIVEFWSRHHPYKQFSSDLDSAATHLLDGFRSSRGRQPGDQLGWNEEFSTGVIYNKWSIISLGFNWWSFTGGPHANVLMFLRSFDTRTGAILSLDDLFIEGYRDSLNILGERRLRELRQIDDTTLLSDLGYEFPDDVFQLNDNFYVTKDGLEFFFNEYEGHGYRPGGTTIDIPFHDITGLIRRDGPLARKRAD